MKKLLAVLSLILATTLISTSVSAAEIIIGGSDEETTYNVEHYLEAHNTSAPILGLSETKDGAVGHLTNAKADDFLGYTPQMNYKQDHIAKNGDTTITINYTMDGYASGDVNCDGYIDLLDNALLQRRIAEWDGYDLKKVCLYTSDVNTDGETDALDTLMLLNWLANNNETEYVTVMLNTLGSIKAYDLIPGNNLPITDDIVTDDLERFSFVGWYDSTFTKKYTVVPNEATTLYAKFDRYIAFNFESGTHFDPNNQNRVSIIDNPFGDGKVLSSLVNNCQLSDNAVNGTLRTFNPGAYEGVSNEGFRPTKGTSYTISFKYRYLDATTTTNLCNVSVYGSNSEGIGSAGNKSSAIGFDSNNGSVKLGKVSNWGSFKDTFTYSVDYPYLLLRFSGTTATGNTLYIDDLVIIENTDSTAIKLNIHGEVTSSNLNVGDALPTLDALSSAVTSETCEFLGWFDETLETSYTTVTEGVTTYYAVFDKLHGFTFESGGIYDPKGTYSAENKGKISCWGRVIDPTDKNNICLKANLSQNINNTHFAFSKYDGIDGGFTLKSGISYILTFDYFIDTTDEDFENISIGTRGALESNIGTSGGKTGGLGSSSLTVSEGWNKCIMSFSTNDTVLDYPYFVFLSQASSSTSYESLSLYLDNIMIRETDVDTTLKIATSAYDITYNENGNVKLKPYSIVGGKMLTPPTYYGAEFIDWYDSSFVTPYKTVPAGNIELKAKYNADIINFSNGGYFDPNETLGTGLSKFNHTASPTDSSNKVMKVDFTGDGNTHHFALADSGYNPTEGYKLTVGNTYEISFMYYAESLSEDGVSVHFRGATTDYFGIQGGKSAAYSGVKLTKEGVWTGVTATFTYSEGVDGEQYLLFLAQDSSYVNGSNTCKSIIYFDDIVIKETEPETNYGSKDIKFNGRRPGDTYRYWLFLTGTRKLYLVIPDYNFPYIARMQLDNLVSVYSQMTGQTPEIVKESDWNDSSDYHCNIFVGDVTGDSSDRDTYKISSSSLSADDYAYNFGKSNVYINGGSTYALAMGISEFTNTLINSESSVNFTAGLSYSGKYSEKIDSYSTASYYRPSFLEDFDGDVIDEKYWNIMDIGQFSATSVTEGKTSVRSKEHTYVSDGNLVINGAFDDKYYYGGMLRSHGKLQYKYGYMEVSCIIPNGGGLWTATWLTPTNFNGLYYGEIDVNESYGDATIAQYNIHLWPTAAGIRWRSPNISSSFESKAETDKTFNDEYHTYGFLWTEDKLVATIDGEIRGTYNFNEKNINERYDGLSDYMSLIVSMTVGNPAVSASYKLDESGDYWNTSNKYIVDYVHIYQIDGQDIIFTDIED